MPERNATATWTGTLRDGEGTMRTESGAYEGEFSFATRFGDRPGTNPEELMGAAHAGCFSMALSNELDEAGFTPESVETTATITLEEGVITRSHLETTASVPDIDEETFQEIAEGAKEGCPVSQAFAAIEEITLDATLE